MYVYAVYDYRTMRLFATSDGNAGFAIKSDGGIVSVFNHNTGKERIANGMLALATELGGIELDWFDTTLPHAYGFRVVRRDPWNQEYSPEGWDKARFARFNNGELFVDPGSSVHTCMPREPSSHPKLLSVLWRANSYA